jgi:hypothetical protein
MDKFFVESISVDLFKDINSIHINLTLPLPHPKIKTTRLFLRAIPNLYPSHQKRV